MKELELVVALDILRAPQVCSEILTPDNTLIYLL